MSTLSALASRDLFTPSKFSTPVERPNTPTTASPNNTGASKIEQRTAQLSKNTLAFAQNLLSDFAGQLLGDAAKGMQISFDQFELKASSEAGMNISQSSNGSSSTQAASFVLNDSSRFSGRGTITTADGRKFDFEIEVQYESQQSASYTEQRNTASNVSNTENQAAPTAKRDLSTINYPGVANDLLQSLSAEPVKLPFSLKDENQQSHHGDLVLKLLKLNGGDRYLDWFGGQAPKINQTV